MRLAIKQFPVAVEARNKGAAKEIGQAILNDFDLPNIKAGELIIEVEVGW